MSVEQLITTHLDIWTAADTEKKSGRGRSSGSAGSVYGVKKLRELILELAVRGKLVPQDESDEPASELLKRIAAEKAKLVAEGKIKKSKPLAEITDDEKPFNAPTNWEWVRLGVIGDWGAGATPLRSISSYYGGEIPWFKSGELSADFIDTSEETITNLALKECSLRLNKPGDVLLAMYGATIGKSAILKIAATTNQAVCACTPNTGIWNEYLLVLLKAMKSNFVGQGAGGAQPNISREKIIATVTALPPTKEQHRIVAKVDELMALCDQLENQHNNAAVAHEKLVTHLLGTLTQSQNAEDFNTHWQLISKHFDTLFTTEASIDALKQTLLQLAVMGKLVPQDPNDEPASELLKDIVKTKDQLIKTKKYQKTGKLKQKELLVNYPESWVVVQTGEVCPSVVPSRDKPKSFSGDIPWITLPSFPSDGWYLDTSTFDLGLTLEEACEYTARIIPESSVLMSCVGRFGLTAINQMPVIPNQQIHAFITLEGLVPEFLSIVIRVSGKQMEEMATSTTIAYLNKSNCESIEFGLPPCTEQHRIVAKVDELMAICDQLKYRLTVANQLQQKLADVMTHASYFNSKSQPNIL